MPEADTDALIVGAAPTGLTLARELQLAGVRTIVLERLPEPRVIPKAGGLGGQRLEMLRHRGLLERFEAASGKPPTPRFPFGGLHVDLTRLADNPMQAPLLPQPRMESLLEDLARELGAEMRREHELVGLSQDQAAVTTDVRGPAGRYRITARYLVGCDGAHSRVRAMAGIAFPGTTHPEVNRLGSFAMPDSVTLLDDGNYEIAGLGRVPFGYTQTDRGVFAISSYTPTDLGLYTSEEEADPNEYDDEPLTVPEFEESIQRVLGVRIPLREPTRMTRFTFHARHVERYREGRILVAGDAAHLFPSGGVAVNAGMLDALNLAWKLAAEIGGWAPDGLLDTYHDERHFAGRRTLLHTQAQVARRPGLDSADDALREVVSELLLDEPARHRIGAMIAGADIRYPMPGFGPNALAGTFATAGLAADFLHAGRPVLLDLADRADLRDVARDWADRVELHTVAVDDRPADAVLIRPDGYIARAATVDEPYDTATTGLRKSLTHWFGAAPPVLSRS
jgi:2-polyprenyl-6-methoxyphenol hydroxylase-like FAD-dependent oxidoreductase